MRAPYTDSIAYYTDYQQNVESQGNGWHAGNHNHHPRVILRPSANQMMEPKEITVNVPTTWSTRSSSDVGQRDSGPDSIGEKLHKPPKNRKGSKKSKKDSPPSSSTTSQHNTYKMKFKTELCKNFQLQGSCKFGDACCYAHGQEELRDKTHLNSNYKSKICKHFHGQGGCPYGQR